MRIHKIGNTNIFLVAMIMTAVLLCWSSKAQAAQTVDGFVTEWDNILINNGGVECVALANQYNAEVVGCPWIDADVASDWYNYYSNDPNEPIYYTRLDASQQPQKGDLAVWSTYPGNGGRSHIALVVDPLSGNSISCFTQNPLPAQVETLTRTGLLGYLRPKIFINTNDAQLNVKVNGSTVAFDQPPVIINNRTLVPLRAIFEALGAQVNWNDATKTVTATKGDTIITAVIGSTQAIVNGVRKILDVPAQIFNSRTLVPVRFISESLGAKVDWDEASQTVVITDGQVSVGNWTNPPVFEDMVLTNQGNNIVNGGLVAQQGDWIYYLTSKYFSLYKIRTDGSGNTRLNDDGSSCINVVGDWIYYATWSKGIYKTRTDGSERTSLSDDGADRIYVVGDWIYYYSSNYNDNSKLYKIRTDGSGRTSVNDIKTGNTINVAGGWIYYTNNSDGDTLYKIRTDGSEPIRLNNDKSYDINLAGDWVYYRIAKSYGLTDDTTKLYKIRTDGSERTYISDDKLFGINVAGDWIYYSNWIGDYDWKLYKIRTDGSDRTLLSDDEPYSINVAGDWVYYRNNGSSGDSIYRIKTDGSCRELVQ